MSDIWGCDSCTCCGEYACTEAGIDAGRCGQTCPCNPRSDYPPDPPNPPDDADTDDCGGCACATEAPRDPHDPGTYPGPDPDCDCWCHEESTEVAELRRSRPNIEDGLCIVLLSCGHWIQPEVVDAGTRTWLCPFGDLTQPAARDEAGIPAVIGSWDYVTDRAASPTPSPTSPIRGRSATSGNGGPE